jgi:hypothetical protein
LLEVSNAYLVGRPEARAFCRMPVMEAEFIGGKLISAG